MRKKFNRKYIILILLVLILIFLIYFYNNLTMFDNIFKKSNKTGTESTTTTTTEETVEKKDIINSLDSSGEISSTLDEKVELHATYYLKETFVKVGDTVKSGENILEYTNGKYLTAPYDCVIINISVPDIKAQCTNEHYIEIKSLESLKMTVSIDEDELNKISIGQEAQIQVLAYTDKKIIGYVTNISNTATYSSSGSKFNVTVEFENDGDVMVGMTGKCSIILEKAEDVVVVPIEAVTTSGKSSTVTKINQDGTTETVAVTTGISNDAYIQIKSGLSQGDKVQIIKTSTSSSNGGMQMNQGMKDM